MSLIKHGDVDILLNRNYRRHAKDRKDFAFEKASRIGFIISRYTAPKI